MNDTILINKFISKYWSQESNEILICCVANNRVKKQMINLMADEIIDELGPIDKNLIISAIEDYLKLTPKIANESMVILI